MAKKAVKYICCIGLLCALVAMGYAEQALSEQDKDGEAPQMLEKQKNQQEENKDQAPVKEPGPKPRHWMVLLSKFL